MSDITVALTCHDRMPDSIATQFVAALEPILRQWNLPLVGDKLSWRNSTDGKVFSVYLSPGTDELARAVAQNVQLWCALSQFRVYEEWSWTCYPTDQNVSYTVHFTWL